MPAEIYRIKPLEWWDDLNDPPQRHGASTLGFAYFLDAQEGEWLASVHYWGCGEARSIGAHASLDDAKAAAQADLKERIFSAIEFV